jgi:hypothetical protein
MHCSTPVLRHHHRRDWCTTTSSSSRRLMHHYVIIIAETDAPLRHHHRGDWCTCTLQSAHQHTCTAYLYLHYRPWPVYTPPPHLHMHSVDPPIHPWGADQPICTLRLTPRTQNYWGADPPIGGGGYTTYGNIKLFVFLSMFYKINWYQRDDI